MPSSWHQARWLLLTLLKLSYSHSSLLNPSSVVMSFPKTGYWRLPFPEAHLVQNWISDTKNAPNQPPSTSWASCSSISVRLFHRYHATFKEMSSSTSSCHHQTLEATRQNCTQHLFVTQKICDRDLWFIQLPLQGKVWATMSSLRSATSQSSSALCRGRWAQRLCNYRQSQIALPFLRS